ncbi:hypothetical protein [Rubricoccus marinus]|uniref:DUF3618 domain-containing protein n=1 Tax=Rubricoccus marinus TaxID=716817 RepID=A0A259TYN3_9BACT|nr:hypothetical protein [Rubricoccus marinus]OZC02684.1 hypothetical protein BSZ36_06665 [Rubricoccus marinus]
MADLQNTSGPSPGPAIPTSEELLPLPSAHVELGDGVDLSSLSAEDIRARLNATQRDMKFRIQAIKHEVAHVADDVNIDGRPLSDRFRERPLAALALAIASGATLGLLWGLRRRSKRLPSRDERTDVVQYHVAALLDAAALRVARGASADEALQAEVRKRPVVFVPREDETTLAGQPGAKKQAFDVAMKTAVGIGVKTGLDLLTKRFTNHEEVFEALADEASDG